MIAIAGALLGLILLLATLQYRWLGQISGAERERMTANLNTRATAFAQDFDREITRAYLLFQMDPMRQDTNPAVGLVTRYDRWQATARFPKMIKEIYVLSSPEGGGELGPPQRFNPATRYLEPAEWPAALSQVRTELARRVPTPAGTSNPAADGKPSVTNIVMRPMIATVWPSVPALVIPAPMLMLNHVAGNAPTVQMAPTVRYNVLLLDGDYIKGEMFSGLAQAHFQGTGDGFDYQLAVVSTTSKDSIYRSVAEFAPAADSPADAKVDLFQVRTKDFESLVNEVTRFATITSMTHLGGGRGQTFIRETIGSPANIAIGTPRSFIFQQKEDSPGQMRLDTTVSRASATVALDGHLIKPSPHWRLLVKHPSGSLEQAVNAVRRRNLLVSTSILGILGVSVGFLVLSTRRAQDLARQQLEFVATVSHELRTPLAVIRSAADNLADGVVNDEARIRQYGQLVRREGLRLTDLVEQILEFAGLQSAQRTMSRHPVEVSGLLRDVAAAAESTAQSAGIAIELDIADNLPAVAGDEAALRRVFQNLIGNAIKYGADARWIGVRAALSGGDVEVSVTDRGIGIAAAEQKKIFDPFYRAPDVVAAQIQGAGLGLSLVKRIVEAHAGQVTLKSAPGAGSTFTVTLPVMNGDAAPKIAGDVSQASAQPLQSS
jgi:two-component system, OmpR family, sensor histidine kinase SenX3